MACEKCEEMQDGGSGIAYYRWGKANIGMLGCNEHLKEIFETLNRARILKPDMEKLWESRGKHPISMSEVSEEKI